MFAQVAGGVADLVLEAADFAAAAACTGPGPTLHAPAHGTRGIRHTALFGITPAATT